MTIDRTNRQRTESPETPTTETPHAELLRVVSRMECKQETMMELVRQMDDSIRRMTIKLAAVAAVVSMTVSYFVRDLSWLTDLIGGL